MKHARLLGYHKNNNLQIMGIEGGGYNVFNKIIIENFPNLEIEKVIQVQEAF
jgi:hypothetical protein